MKKNNKNGFTLVELLAVIVILAIILVIAVPKVMSIIEDAKMGTLESTAKMIASAAEKQKVQNTVLGNTEEITCDSVVKINKGDYANCSIEFVDNTAKVTIEGSGKFDGLYVCGGTKTSAEAQKESCVEPIQVKNPPFLAGQLLTPDKFEVTLTESDGSTRVLKNGTKLAEPDVSKSVTVTSPNWPNNYPTNMTEEENTWEYTFEDAKRIQITFDETSKTNVDEEYYSCESYCSDYADDTESCLKDCASDYMYSNITIVGEKATQEYYGYNKKILFGTSFAGQTYTIYGDYIKITMKSDSNETEKGFSATIAPIYYEQAEYTVSPSVVPNTEGNFDITIELKNENISKKITTKSYYKISDYVASHNGFDTTQTNAEYNGTIYDAGIRYIADDGYFEKNSVYYNCDDKDKNGVTYGKDNYDYKNSCEVWDIIGVFDVNNGNGSVDKRVKLVNTSSLFSANWNSNGINQWGESGDYEGSEIMQLLNGYYIGKNGATCIYDGNQTCTSDSLKNAGMKVLTNTAKEMIENAVWDTYAVKYPQDVYPGDSSWAPKAYLEEKGISAQYTGISECSSCNDGIIRTTSWTGLVGLMSVSDYVYSNLEHYAWGFTPSVDGTVWGYLDGLSDFSSYNSSDVNPTVYLKNEIMVIGGDGTYSKPYILKAN